jgi:repressor LexA
MEKRNVKAITLTTKAGLSRSAISDWRKKKAKPSYGALVKIAKYFNVSVEYLEGKTDVPYQPKEPKALPVPVLGTIPAGIPIEAIEDIIDWEEVPIEWASGGKEYFGLQLKGDSMAPRYQGGDVVIFLKVSTCDSGDKCAVIVNDCEATFKQVIKQDNGIVLQPLNVSYEPVFYSNQDIEELPVRIIGVAKELRGKIN